VRHSGVPFAVVRPTALTEEPAGAELQVDQGDTIKVCRKSSTQTAAVATRGGNVWDCRGNVDLSCDMLAVLSTIRSHGICQIPGRCIHIRSA